MIGDRGGGEVLLCSWEGGEGAMISRQKLATCEVTIERKLR